MNLGTVIAAVKHGGVTAGIALAVVGAPAVASATTWDVTAQYSTTNNPDGVWSYGWEAAGALNPTLNLYNTTGPTIAPVNSIQWYDVNHHSVDYTPTIWLNTSGTEAYGVLPGQVSLHPGWDGSYSVARWTSPIAGQVDVTGFFGAGDTGAMSYYISINGSTVYQRVNDQNTYNFSFSPTVFGGETIDFIVGFNTVYGYVSGNTPLDVTITTTSVPEPSTWALMAPRLSG